MSQPLDTLAARTSWNDLRDDISRFDTIAHWSEYSRDMTSRIVCITYCVYCAKVHILYVFMYTGYISVKKSVYMYFFNLHLYVPGLYDKV